MGLQNEDDVRREIERHLQHAGNAAIWKQLCSDGNVDDVIDSASPGGGRSYTVDDLLERYRELERLVNEGMTAPAEQRQAQQHEPRPIPADAAAEARCAITAVEAADQPYVRAFREQVLGGRLLGWQEANAWLAEKLSQRRIWTRIHLPHWYPRASAARDNPWQAEQAVKDYMAGGHMRDGNEADTQLDFLYCVCDLLITRYYWLDRDEEAALFVLCGRPPSSLLEAFTYAAPEDSDDPRNGLIAIYVSPRVGPRELMELYTDFRRGILGAKVRARGVSEEVSVKALFIAKANDGRSWSAAMADWNRSQPGADYTDTRLFARDCRSAYRRVMGKELAWRFARGSVVEPPSLQPDRALFAEIEAESARQQREHERRDRKRRLRKARSSATPGKEQS